LQSDLASRDQQRTTDSGCNSAIVVPVAKVTGLDETLTVRTGILTSLLYEINVLAIITPGVGEDVLVPH
jgi:hypothetical protein